jgi:hypothetical protein
MTGPVAPASTRISIAGRATSVPFTTALNGPEQTTTDNRKAASTCAVPIPAGRVPWSGGNEGVVVNSVTMLELVARWR